MCVSRIRAKVGQNRLTTAQSTNIGQNLVNIRARVKFFVATVWPCELRRVKELNERIRMRGLIGLAQVELWR